MTNLVVQNQCPLDQAEHVSMAADPVVAQDVLNALDPGHPTRALHRRPAADRRSAYSGPRGSRSFPAC